MTHLPNFGSQRRDERLGHYGNSDGTVLVSLLSFRRKCRLRLATHLDCPQLALLLHHQLVCRIVMPKLRSIPWSN